MYISDTERAAVPPNFDYASFELPEHTALTMRLSPHGSKGDLPPEAELHADIKRHDAVIIEMIATPDKVALLEKTSKGRLKEYQRLRDIAASDGVEFSSWLQRVGAALYNSRVAPVVIDIPVTHPSARRLMDKSSRVNRKIVDSKDEEGLLQHKPLLAQQHEIYQSRDQAILKNLAPRLGKLGLQASRAAEQHRQLDILALYGSIHRSLFDALQHKASLESGHDFTLKDHPDSTKRHLRESMYAYFLRGMEVPDETMVQYFTWVQIAVGIRAGNYEKSMASTDELIRIGSLLGEGKSYAEAKELGKRLTRQEVIIVDPNGGKHLKDKLSSLVAKHGATVEDHGELFLVQMK